MCDLNQPKPASGPTLCNEAQELIVQRVIAGDRNNAIRILLKNESHRHDLSDQAFTPYRKLPLVKEARSAAIASVKDVGVVALARRIDRLELRISRMFDRLDKGRKRLQPAEEASLTRAVVVACREMSRLADTLDLDSIPHSCEVNAPVVSIEQILAAARVLREKYMRDQAAKAEVAVQTEGVSGASAMS